MFINGYWLSTSDQLLLMLSRVINGYQWLQRVINGYQSVINVYKRYQWLSMAIKDYISQLSMVINGYLLLTNYQGFLIVICQLSMVIKGY